MVFKAKNIRKGVFVRVRLDRLENSKVEEFRRKSGLSSKEKAIKHAIKTKI